MLYIVGLGNPGDNYAKSRHNAGFMVLDVLAGEDGWQKDSYANALVKSGAIDDVPVLYLKPQTFMNRSGESLRHMRGKKDAYPEDMIVVHDDTDVAFGEIKVSFGRGSGGHHGVDSIVDALGTNEFYRIRIGMRPKRLAISKLFGGRKKASEIVLKSLKDEEMQELKTTVSPLVEKAIEDIVVIH